MLFNECITNYKTESDNHELRFVIDMGSGSTKAKFLLVDTLENKIIDTFSESVYLVPYQQWITQSPDHTISFDQIMHSLSIVDKMLEENNVNPYIHKCAGIATAWAREAENADQIIDILRNKMNIKLKIIDQQEEGELGFKAAKNYLLNNNLDEEGAIFWDIGGGSFQMGVDIDNNIYVYSGQYGSSNLFRVLRDFINVDNEGLIPSKKIDTAITFLKNNIAKYIPLDDVLVHYLGSSFYFAAIGQVMNKDIKPLFQKDWINIDEIKQAIDDFANSNSFDEIVAKYPGAEDNFIDYTHVNLLLIYSIMDTMLVNDLYFVDASSIDTIAFEDNIWNDDSFMHISEDEYNMLVS